MREITFRGFQPELQKWVYGDLIKTPGGGRFIFEWSNGFENRIDVNPNTVGQYTGLDDILDIPVYAGDIRRIFLPAGGFWGDTKIDKVGVVRFEPEEGGYIVEWKGGKNQNYIRLNFDLAYESVLLGNIHENPELL